MLIIKQNTAPPIKWAVFDDNELLTDNLSESELEEFVVSKFRLKFKDSLIDFKPTMSYLEARVRAGRIKCCDCARPVSISDYNQKWTEERQRCRACMVK